MMSREDLVREAADIEALTAYERAERIVALVGAAVAEACRAAGVAATWDSSYAATIAGMAIDDCVNACTALTQPKEQP